MCILIDELLGEERAKVQWETERQMHLMDNDQRAEQEISPSHAQPWDVVFNERQSLIWRALKASSCDNTERQSIDQTRMYFDRKARFGSFWSSSGSASTNANEYLAYALKDARMDEHFIDSYLSNADMNGESEHADNDSNNDNDDEDGDDSETEDAHLGKEYSSDRGHSHRSDTWAMIIHELRCKPFMANWQNNNIYPSQRVSISLGVNRERHKTGVTLPQFDLFTSEVFDMQNLYEFQRFPVGPILIIAQEQQRDFGKEDAEAMFAQTEHTKQQSSTSRQRQTPFHIVRHVDPRIQTTDPSNEYIFNDEAPKEQEEVDEEEEDIAPAVQQRGGTPVDHEIMIEAFERFGTNLSEPLIAWVRKQILRKRQLAHREELRQRMPTLLSIRVN